MLELESPNIATASVEGQSRWTWSLKLDDFGLYRWYLDGVAETNIRGGTRSNAEYALRRFVERSLNGKLKITELLRINWFLASFDALHEYSYAGGVSWRATASTAPKNPARLGERPPDHDPLTPAPSRRIGKSPPSRSSPDPIPVNSAPPAGRDRTRPALEAALPLPVVSARVYVQHLSCNITSFR